MFGSRLVLAGTSLAGVALAGGLCYMYKNHSRSRSYQRVYVDTEYIIPAYATEELHKGNKPKDGDLREIVQIAAILVDTRDGREKAALNMMIRPTIVPRAMSKEEFHSLAENFRNFNSLDIRELKSTFPEALEKFQEFCGNHEIWTMDADWRVLRQNCQLNNISFPFSEVPFTRVKEQLLDEFGVGTNGYSSGTLHKLAGIKRGELHERLGIKEEDMQGDVHNALHDVRSMAAAMYVFEDCRQQAEKLKIKSRTPRL